MDPATTQAVDKVAGLIKASESVSESRLAMLISLMIIICVIWLPAALKQRYSEAEVRRRVQTVLPVATFFSIQWY